MAKSKSKPSKPVVGPKGRPLTGIRLVLVWEGKDAPIPFLTALAGLTPTQRERTVSVGRAGSLGVRLVLEYPYSETRDIDEAVRDLPAAYQPNVVHAEKFPATA